MSAFSTTSFPSFRKVLLFSAALRVALILYSEWHDARSLVKYTDVDYRVFTDAAWFLSNPGPGAANRAEGPLKELFGVKLDFGNPYTRETYRYTPLLAWLLTPNGWLHPSFGKYIFAACDLLNGWLIYKILLQYVLPKIVEQPKATSNIKPASNASSGTKAGKVNPYVLEKRQSLATIYSAVHLLNPLVFSISTRGSSESILSLFVLATLYAAMKGRWNLAAMFLGLSTHWKIYPLVYGVGTLGAIAAGSSGHARGLCAIVSNLVTRKTIQFTALSAVTFVLLGAGCYAIWGYPFLYESYIYHLRRLDHRHNFSPYFYLTYLTYPSSDTSVVEEPVTLLSQLLHSPLTSFVPQMGLSLGLGLLFGRTKEDLPFAWFLQTVAFVVFNKVCTSQYFLWYLLLLPLLLPRLSMSRWKAMGCIVVWAAAQGLWLSEAYRLEFLGENVYFQLWIRGLIYVVGNCWVLVEIMKAYN
ncbi:GPI mannosyltransferase 1 [Coprinopsis cinerea okayama7|uniref:GPI mannosyltransferase 1 n=1 Tax=Coprinopsis cinerea (strain Okayama-7 / 130 / ATCC MYA-4618 / FGSC 9003) TaxID=240176 RepID=A8NEB2_COPC7|nr:GPI mannosyltransferase 1 [Coprinopsis cinerea okayama7\|eukprot:XP_001832977.1 GPI mannosyltransferase 1 [Coprinopsis cinerea okayama7\